MRRGMTISLSAALFSIIASPAFAGGTHDEMTAGGDAGSLPSTAQPAFGVGSLGTIIGQTGLEGEITDFQDMYIIRIVDPVNFTASTVGNALFDTQLWLFSADGRGLLANDDDFDSGTLQSLIPFSSDDMSGQTIPLGEATYFLAISGFNDDARCDPDPPTPDNEMFFIANDNEVSGPDGMFCPLQSIAGWEDNGATGEYTIELTGCEFVSAPIPSHSEWTLIIMTLVLLTAGTILLRRQPHAKPA